jgi:hypothetical protein
MHTPFSEDHPSSGAGPLRPTPGITRSTWPRLLSMVTRRRIHTAEHLATFLATCKARGWIKTRGTQRTDSTSVLAAIRTLQRLECVLEAMHWALNQLSDAASPWVQQHVPLEWYARYGLRSDQTRLPKDISKREALARQIGADGYQLLEWIGTPSRRIVRKDRPVSNGRQAMMSRVIRSYVSGLIGPRVVCVPPAVYVLRPKTLPGN